MEILFHDDYFSKAFSIEKTGFKKIFFWRFVHTTYYTLFTNCFLWLLKWRCRNRQILMDVLVGKIRYNDKLLHSFKYNYVLLLITKCIVNFQEFPILCPTCLGDNPYVRMVSKKRLIHHSCFITFYVIMFSR